jgi:hypothetical protein
MQVVPVKTAGRGIFKLLRRREHPLPGPLPLRALVFPLESVRESNATSAAAQILFVTYLESDAGCINSNSCSIRRAVGGKRREKSGVGSKFP